MSNAIQLKVVIRNKSNEYYTGRSWDEDCRFTTNVKEAETFNSIGEAHAKVVEVELEYNEFFPGDIVFYDSIAVFDRQALDAVFYNKK